MWRSIMRGALLLAGLVAAGLALLHLPGGGAQAALDRLAALAGGNGGGAAWFVAAGGALCAVAVPRQAVAYAGGYAFGLWGGSALSLAAQMLGCVANLAWARLVARDWARRRLRGDGRLARLDRFLSANTFAATLLLRLLPVGNNTALNLLAGASGVSAWRFLLGSALGFVPQTVLFALIGAGVRVDGMAQIGLGVALLAGSAALGVVLLRRLRAAA
ncbi:MAG: hypothetical protein ABS99_10460 [Acetobacteraceae bacterium SCN 69-10]|nr:MAG: hypothetical protein ABS99_10460 [Acetobacteraceae bacterium SCN 69-10]OJY70592.1 MAG: hypothetical protein BGP12_21360 [Rhodospirillales bacterium 70-18]